MGKLQLWSFPFTYLCAAFNVFYGIEITWSSFSCFFRLRICQGHQQQFSQAPAQGLCSQSTNDSNLWRKGHGYQRGFDDSKDGSAICLFPSEIPIPFINKLRTSAQPSGPRESLPTFEGTCTRPRPGVVSDRSNQICLVWGEKKGWGTAALGEGFKGCREFSNPLL